MSQTLPGAGGTMVKQAGAASASTDFLPSMCIGAQGTHEKVKSQGASE